MTAVPKIMIVYFGVLVLGALALMANANRYAWHISKPKFKVGDCVVNVEHKEFYDEFYYQKIIKVGKGHYLVKNWLPDYHVYGSSQYEQSFEYTDDYFSKSDECGK